MGVTAAAPSSTLPCAAKPPATTDASSQPQLSQSIESLRAWNAKRKFKGAVKAIMMTNRMSKLIGGARAAAKEEAVAEAANAV